MIALNLLPDVKIEYLRTKRAQSRVIGIATIVTIAAVGLVVLLAAYVYGGQTLIRNSLTDQIDKNLAELKAVPDVDKYYTIQNQLDNITALHNGKSDFSRVMTYLPLLNPAAPNNVTLTEVGVSSGSSETGVSMMSFQGETGNYTALSTFRDTLLNARLSYVGGEGEKLFESVTVTSSALQGSSTGVNVVVFKIDTVYNPNAFLFSVKEPVVTVPSKTTTQSAVAAPNVFGESTTVEETQ